ncbi:uncharacterized protein TNCV_1395661 [Trichonephila clavipes]|nr:uncharacterized protein TNCV_1395661 [Trichonephila clavipes]
MNSEKSSPSSKDKKMVKSVSKCKVKKKKTTKSGSFSKLVKNTLLNGRISKDTKQLLNAMSPVVEIKKLELKNICPDSLQKLSCANNGSSEGNDKKENSINNEEKCEVEEVKSPLSVRERLKKFVKKKSVTKGVKENSHVCNSKKNADDVMKRNRPISSKCNSVLKIETLPNSECIKSFHQKELNDLSEQRDSKNVEPGCLISDQGIPNKNLLSSLLFEILRTSDKSDILKMKPIIINSSYDFGCNSDASLILDTSLVLSAFKHFEYQRTKCEVSSTNLHADEDIWESNYAVINKINLSCSKNLENTSPILNLNSESLSSQNIAPDNCLKDTLDKHVELFSNEVLGECIQGTNEMGLQDISVSYDHNNADLAEHSNDTVINLFKKSSEIVKNDKITENCFRENQNQILADASDINVESKSQNDLKKTEDQLIISSKSNSNSRQLCETDILGADVLDYEPSEISDRESLVDDDDKHQASGDLELVEPTFEKETSNVVNKKIYCEVDSYNIYNEHLNEQDVLNTDNCEIYSDCTDDNSITENKTYSECSSSEEYREYDNKLMHENRNFNEPSDKIIQMSQDFSKECGNYDRFSKQNERQNYLLSNNNLINQNLSYPSPKSGSELQQESLFTNDCNHTNTSDSSLSSLCNKFNFQSSRVKSLNSSKNIELDVFSKEFKNFNASMCEINHSSNEHSSDTDINKKSSRKRSFNFIDDSDSDSEHSFKRRSGNACQVDESSQSQIPFDPNGLEEVISSIREECDNSNINGALCIAHKYIPVSIKHVQKVLFKELFYCIIDYISDLDFSLDKDLWMEAIKNCMEIFYDYSLYDSELCSGMILECLSCNLAVLNGSQVLSFCQKNNIPISSEAISSYVKVMKPTEMSVNEIISFLEYETKVCKQLASKTLVHEVLERFVNGKESSFSADFFLMCKFLCYVSSNEVDKRNLQKFIEFCIEKNFWKEIADFFVDWANKNFIVNWLCETLVFRIEDSGLFYQKLAEEIFGRKNALLDHPNSIMVQIGVSLMMEVFSKQLYENAFEILCTLHKHDVNYLELQKPTCTAHIYIKALSEPTDILLFSIDVAFAALEICLHVKRPKDAYKVLCQISTNLTVDFADKLNLNIKNRWFYYLLTLTLQLHSVDPLGLGLEAFQNLVSVSEKEFSVGELSNYGKDTQAVFNKYLISFINGKHNELIKKFYPYTYGQNKDLFVLENQVIRAILIFLIKNDLVNEVEKFYVLGYSRNIYKVGKQTCDKHPQRISMSSSWTSEEIRYVFLKFIESHTPTLKLKPPEIDFNQWFAMKISVKETNENNCDINYLNETATDLKCAKERICNVLTDLDSNIKWNEDGCKSLNLVPETFYNFWILFSQKCSSEPKTEKTESFKIPEKVHVSFGNGVPQIKPLKISVNNKKLNTTPKALLNDKDNKKKKKKKLSKTILKSSNLVTPSKTTEKGFSSPMNYSVEITSPKINSDDDTYPSNSYSQMNSSRNVSFKSIEQGLQIDEQKQLPDPADLKNIKITIKSSSTQNVDPCTDSQASKPLFQPQTISPIRNLELSASEPTSKRRLQPVTSTPALNVKLSTVKPISKRKLPPKTNFVVQNVELATVEPISEVCLQPQIMKTSTARPSLKPDVPDSIFQKITNFLKSKVILKRKDLSSEQQLEITYELACTFIQNNDVSTLDKRRMKLLYEFADKFIC